MSAPSANFASYALSGDDPMSNEGSHLTLDKLQDRPQCEKPGYPYAVLARAAIQSSPRRKLLLSEIYESISLRFPYYQLSQKTWKVRD